MKITDLHGVTHDHETLSPRKGAAIIKQLPGSENTKQMPCPDSGCLWDLTPLRNKNSHSFGLGPTPSGAGGISGRPYGRSQILEVVPLVNCTCLQLCSNGCCYVGIPTHCHATQGPGLFAQAILVD
ncbi:hypothetical protein AOLI_G00197640 [Acnodon oligacanthus]